MNPDYSKLNGLIPAIIQDNATNKVLMLGFMNQEALEKTQETGFVTFFSRTRNRLWTKGETSGNFLRVVEISVDCDNDTLLVKALPSGPVCHTGSATCFGEENQILPESKHSELFIKELEQVIRSRRSADPKSSYTASLFSKGKDKIAQKVGEEAVETVIEAVGKGAHLQDEIADLIYHLLVLMAASDISIAEIDEVLRKRHKK